MLPILKFLLQMLWSNLRGNTACKLMIAKLLGRNVYNHLLAADPRHLLGLVAIS